MVLEKNVKNKMDSYTATKKWLATNPDGKLPISQKAER